MPAAGGAVHQVEDSCNKTTCTNKYVLSCVREAGFKLEGVTGEVESESVAASVEECAKLCLYQKSAETGGR